MGAVLKGKPDLDKRIERAVDDAIELADLGGILTPSYAIAERIFDSEPALMLEAHRPWGIERLTWMVARRRRMRRKQEQPDLQLVLDDPIFKDLPSRIFLKDGSREKLDNCSISQIEGHLKLLRQRYKKHRKIEQIGAVLEKMRTHTGERRGLTWGEVKQMIADELNGKSR